MAWHPLVCLITIAPRGDDSGYSGGSCAIHEPCGRSPVEAAVAQSFVRHGRLCPQGAMPIGVQRGCPGHSAGGHPGQVTRILRIVGVAGPAGSGKSTVCRMLARRTGVAFVNCDELAWGTYRPSGPSYAPLVARFGEDILTHEGAVDRERLGHIALNDPQAKADLEAIVHPAVMDELKQAAAENKKRGTEVLLVEGALLLTSPHVDRDLFDAFVWLHAPEDVRHKRLLSSGLEGSSVRRRLQAQADLSPPVDPSVYPIDASGRPAQVADRVWSLIQSLKQCGSRGAESM